MGRPKAWSLDPTELGLGGKRSFRPTIMGTNGMVASGHYLSTLAGVQVLQEGGNAIDAGVAAVVAGTVVQSDMTSFGGVASINIYRSDLDRSFTVAGVGHWPALASIEFFQEKCGGRIPNDVRNAVVPGAPDAFLTALEQFGSWSFGRAARRAIELAKEGFPMFPFRYQRQVQLQDRIKATPTTMAVMWPDGRQPEVGEIFRQPDLGWTIQTMAEAEAGVRLGSRAAGFQAARNAFYRGEIADRIERFYVEQGGLLRKSDMADFRVTVDPPMVGSWNGYEIRTCPFWCMGPMLIQVLNVLEQDDLKALGHNSPEYIHLVTEAMKLAFADRHAYYGDPRMVEVPAEGLLSKEYARERRKLIDPKKAWPEMPPAGDPYTRGAVRPVRGGAPEPRREGSIPSLDTSHLSVIDRWGNAFGVTFSDAFSTTPITPGTGLTVSPRGRQAWADPTHPNRVRPGQRPMMNPQPAMAFKDGELRLALGSPGSDVQIQAVVQVLLNILEFGMEPQEAIEAPRFGTYSHPDSFEPHSYLPGVLRVEARVPDETMARLEELGHKVEHWVAWNWQAGGVCAITRNPETGVLAAGAEPRRENYAIGW